jgi:hypothetical protein
LLPPLPKPSKRERRRSLLMGLWRAQGKKCAVCGVGMLPVHYLHQKRGWSIEHVYPQGRYHFYNEGNRLLSHIECNNGKGERDPTGCEVLLLHSANAVMGIELREKPLLLQVIYEPKRPTSLTLAFQRAMGINQKGLLLEKQPLLVDTGSSVDRH